MFPADPVRRTRRACGVTQAGLRSPARTWGTRLADYSGRGVTVAEAEVTSASGLTVR